MGAKPLKSQSFRPGFVITLVLFFEEIFEGAHFCFT